MAIIVDADVIILAEKGGFDFKNWCASFLDEDFEIAAITVAELWHGVERASGLRRRSRETFLRELILPLTVIAYSEEIAYEHARIWAELEAKGKMIGHYDLIVAATAIIRGCSVATFNTRHFKQVPGLKVITPV
jgi:tRNA(fMet)-specific endonuclease VapC